MSGDVGGPDRHLTVMIVPDGGEERRTLRISYRRLRVLLGGAVLAALALVVMAGSWWYLAARASRVGDMEEQVREMEKDQARVGLLANRLEEVERRYEHIRSLFGSAPEAPSEVWLPPAGSSGGGGGAARTDRPSLPASWPLAERGFVTQGLLDAPGTEHPGLDIAVPADSYIRAAGGGMVVDCGEDPVYGQFVVVDHGEGYTTLYAHASLLLVERGDRVRQEEVIALSGSTGRSTAPHLHFEVLLNGDAVDPLSMVTQP